MKTSYYQAINLRSLSVKGGPLGVPHKMQQACPEDAPQC